MLEVRELSKVYTPKKGPQVLALDRVNLQFEKTGMVFVLGKSGSGKSTLLNLIGGLDSITSGEVVIKGKSSIDFTQSDFDRYRNTFLGFIFQEYNILNEFTVGKNISLALELQGKKANREAVDSILQEVDLAGFADRKPNELSGGQKQRVAIARALIKDPEIILADEPTGALDSNTGKQVFETLQKLSRTKLVIIVSHDREYAEYYGDRVIEFADGHVISDIKKYQAGAVTINDNMQVIDNSIMHIKPGVKLSEQEKTEVIRFLDSNPNEVIISRDSRSNFEFRKQARIDKDGNKEAFKYTDGKDLQIENYNPDDFKLIKSTLPFKHSLKMAVSSLKIKPIRLFFTILLCAVAFCLFGLADTFAAYKKNDVHYNSIRSLNLESTGLVKVKEVKSDYGDYYYTYAQAILDSDISKFKKNVSTEMFPVNSIFSLDNYSYSSASIQSANFRNIEITNKVRTINNSFYSYEIYGYINSTQQEFNDFGLDIVAGEYPTEKNEILISDYIFKSLKYYGLYDADSSSYSSLSIDSYSDILGKSLALTAYTEKKVVVSGVFQTNTNFDPYNDLKSDNSGNNVYNQDTYAKQQALATVVQYGVDGAIFTSPEFNFGIAAYDGTENNSYEQTFLDINGFTEIANTDFGFNLYENYSNQKYFDFEYVANINDINTSKMMSLNGGNQFAYEINNYRNYIGVSYTVFKKIRDEYFNQYPNEKIKYQQGVDYYNTLVGQSYTDFEIDILSLTEYTNFNWHSGSYEGSLLYGGVGITNDSYYIHAVYDDTNDTIHSNTVIIGNSFINDYNNLLQKYFYSGSAYTGTKYILAKTPSSGSDLKKLISYSSSKNKSMYYEIMAPYSYVLSNYGELIELLSKGFVYAGIVLAVFASLLLLNFIAVSITNKKKEIGILRAVGAKSSDVFKIFYNESLIITLVAVVISLIGCGIAVAIINNAFGKTLGVMLKILGFSIRQILFVIGVGVLVATVASFIPVYNISRKKPIDTIRNA